MKRLKVYRHKNENIIQTNETVIDQVISVFKDSDSNYGSRRIRDELKKLNINLSIPKIRQIMAKNGLYSVYNNAKYKKKQNYNKTNKDDIGNKLDRQFDNKERYEVIVSDLTYVKVAGKWNYICVLIDLFNREIVGHMARPKKDADLVVATIYNSNIPLNKVKMFHTDRGSEFKNNKIDNILQAFGIERSLSNAGNPYDNAVAERTYLTIKREFVRKQNFESLNVLNLKLNKYIKWYNNKRLHSKLNNMSPVEYWNSVKFQVVSNT